MWVLEAIWSLEKLISIYWNVLEETQNCTCLSTFCFGLEVGAAWLICQADRSYDEVAPVAGALHY